MSVLWYECPLVVLACESLHVCAVCIWRCEHAKFCVEVLYAPYIHFHSFIHSLALFLSVCSPAICHHRKHVIKTCFTSVRSFTEVCTGPHTVHCVHTTPVCDISQLLVYLLLYFLLLLLFSVFLHPTKTLCRKRLCLIFSCVSSYR